MDVVVESAVEGMRKPDPKIYTLLCERLGVAPRDMVFLDDIGRNLKPAAAMGIMALVVVVHAYVASSVRRRVTWSVAYGL